MIHVAASVLFATLVLWAPAAAGDTTVTFDAGAEGWSGTGAVEPSGGNPGAHFRILNPDTFGIALSNTTHPEFVFDYTGVASATLSIDVRVDQIEFFGTPVSRPWLVELRDYDNPPTGYPYVSVWYRFGDLSAATHGSWSTFSVTIADTLADDLPAGWGGTGAESPLAEPILPADRTFASVLAGVDEVAFTTYEPGFFFGFTAFDVRLDNVAIATQPIGAAVPAMPGWGLWTLAGIVLAAGAHTIARRRTQARLAP